MFMILTRLAECTRADNNVLNSFSFETAGRRTGCYERTAVAVTRRSQSGLFKTFASLTCRTLQIAVSHERRKYADPTGCQSARPTSILAFLAVRFPARGRAKMAEDGWPFW